MDFVLMWILAMHHNIIILVLAVFNNKIDNIIHVTAPHPRAIGLLHYTPYNYSCSCHYHNAPRRAGPAHRGPVLTSSSILSRQPVPSHGACVTLCREQSVLKAKLRYCYQFY